MELVTLKPTYERQRNQIKSRVDDIFEEITVNESLIARLRRHAKHVMHTVHSCCPDLFPSIFAEAYSSLSKYSQILIEINCKLEDLMMKEIRQWNSSCILDKFNIKAFVWENDMKAVTPNKTKKLHSAKYKSRQRKKTKPVESSVSVKSVKLPTCKTTNSCQKSSDATPKSCKAAPVQKKPNKKSTASSIGGDTEVTNTAKTLPNNGNQVVIAAEKKKKKKKKKSCSKVIPATSENPIKVSIKSGPIRSDADKEKNQSIGKVNKVIENVKLSVNSKYKGYITLMVSPLEFYTCFIVKDIKENFATYKKELEAFSKSYKFPTTKPKGKTITARKQSISSMLGDYALLYSQPAFLRVKIRNWNFEKKDDIVTVDLIDTGGTKNVSVYNLHPLSNKLMSFPAFATRCHLAKVPKDASHMQSIIDYFRSSVNKTATLTIEICDRNNSGIPESLPVVIYDDSSNSCINEMIICKMHKDPKEENESLEKWDPMTDAYKSSMNTYDFDLDDPAASIYGYVGKDYDRVCKLYGNTGKCFKKACKKEHVLLDPKGFTVDKEDVYVRALNPLNIPRVKVLNVRVTRVESPSSFYCVLDAAKSDTKEETLFSLHSYMNESRNILEMKKMLIPPAVGQVILAKFPKDNSWYRARVISVLPEKDECTVFYVDHGGTVKVDFSCIRAIEPQYLHLPFQAIFCEICGIGDQPETSHSVVQYLTENLTDVSSVEIVSSLPGEHPHLLVNLYTSKGENVAEKLLANKLVARKENILLDETKTYLPG